MSAGAGPSGVGRGLLLGEPTGWNSSDDGSIDEHLVGWLRRRLEWQTFATRQIDCNATADLEEVEDGEERIVTPRGWIVDMMMSMAGGVLCGYLFVQLLTVLYYMNSHSLKPKQPHVLLWQTLAAMVLTSSLLIYHGHFRREDGLLSVCPLWDIWAVWISLGFFLNCQALRVVKVHRKRVEELDTAAAVLKANQRRTGLANARQAASGGTWRDRLRAWWLRYREAHRHKLEFYQQLLGWMLPWIFIASVATLDGATCFDVEKRTCSYKKKAYSLTMTCLAALPMFRTALLGHELQRLGTKDSFIEFALLSKGMKIILAAVMTWLGLSYIRNYTPAENSEMYRVCYRQAKTAVFYAAIAYWQISLLGGPVWRLLTDPEGEEERVKNAVRGGIGTKAGPSGRGTSRRTQGGAGGAGGADGGGGGGEEERPSRAESFSSSQEGQPPDGDHSEVGTNTVEVMMIHIKKMKRRVDAWEEQAKQQAKQRRSQIGGSVREGLDRLGNTRRQGDTSPRSDGRGGGGGDSGRTNGDGSRHASLENVESVRVEGGDKAAPRSTRRASSCANMSDGKATPGREAVARWRKLGNVARFSCGPRRDSVPSAGAVSPRDRDGDGDGGSAAASRSGTPSAVRGGASSKSGGGGGGGGGGGRSCAASDELEGTELSGDRSTPRSNSPRSLPSHSQTGYGPLTDGGPSPPEFADGPLCAAPPHRQKSSFSSISGEPSASGAARVQFSNAPPADAAAALPGGGSSKRAAAADRKAAERQTGGVRVDGEASLQRQNTALHQMAARGRHVSARL